MKVMKQTTKLFLRSIGFADFDRVEDVLIQLSIGMLIAAFAIVIMCLGSIFD